MTPKETIEGLKNEERKLHNSVTSSNAILSNLFLSAIALIESYEGKPKEPSLVEWVRSFNHFNNNGIDGTLYLSLIEIARRVEKLEEKLSDK